LLKKRIIFQTKKEKDAAKHLHCSPTFDCSFSLNLAVLIEMLFPGGFGAADAVRFDASGLLVCCCLTVKIITT
jgi:hypothetical protein